MQFDLPLAALRDYRPDLSGIVAEGFDAFWAQTLAAAQARAAPIRLAPAQTALKLVESHDITFSGFDGQPVRAWLNLPAGARGPLPTVVQFLGYGGGRGQAEEYLLWACAGYAHVVMDTRGQGAGWSGGRGSTGATPDHDMGGGPQFPGMLTRGIRSPETSYFRRLFTDAVRLVRDVKGLPMVDESRLAVLGASQGGAVAQAVAGLEPVAAACIDTPFLCHVAQAIRMTDKEPYFEIVRYLRSHRGAEPEIQNTLRHIDGIGFAARARAPALYSAGLMDDICPPRTVFAAFNHYGGPKDITVYPYAHHEGGEIDQTRQQLAFLARTLTG
ncbi:acetylxylan esterase [Oceaniglobus trochenteri]|uniref:acetylxylan esterase n=1 Tax=Oceaniglobus trochenteri TaxID=2763260 RepID=UPI001CFFF437|nr:acetylxylan esterase [Oceaniglobus trochenteri]